MPSMTYSGLLLCAALFIAFFYHGNTAIVSNPYRFKQQQQEQVKSTNQRLWNNDKKRFHSAVSTRNDDYVTQSEFDQTVKMLNNSITALQENLNIVVTQIDKMNTETQSALQGINNRLDSQGSSIETIQKQQEEERVLPPMFYARLETPVTYDHGETYKFEHVILNQDNAYNPSDGKFTCGPTGWYFFTYSLGSEFLTNDYHHYVYGDLMKDGQMIAHARATNYLPSAANRWLDLQASTSVLIKCNEGEKVYIIGANISNSGAKTEFGDFVGMLLRKEE